MRTSLAPTCAAFIVLCLSGCSGGSPFATGSGTTTNISAPITNTGNTTPNPGTTTAVSVMISDPAACKAPNGPLTHVYVTIADVQASTSADAPANDPSFVDLTPNLSAAPQQVDLMGQASSKCFLASLGIGQQIAVGDYQQIRIILTADASASRVSNNACGASYANCVVRSDNSLHDLQLSAETTTGIEIPVTQIANGSLAIDAGEQPSIDLNFDVCSSILQTADGGYELKPVVHAGLVSSTGGSISGMVVSSSTGAALKGGSVIVALEQKGAKSGIDRILMRTAANADGSFVLCPVPQGTYDLVAVGVDGENVAYSAGVETGIQSGQIAGEIPLVPGTRQGVLQGLMATQRTLMPAVPTAAAMQADALQQVGASGTTITVPLLPTQSPYNEAMLTAGVGNCPAGTDCASYSMLLPTVAPNVVACSQQTAQFTQQGSSPGYTAESFAQIPESGGAPDCLSNNVRATTTPGGGPLALKPGETTTAANMSYTQCR